MIHQQATLIELFSKGKQIIFLLQGHKNEVPLMLHIFCRKLLRCLSDLKIQKQSKSDFFEFHLLNELFLLTAIKNTIICSSKAYRIISCLSFFVDASQDPTESQISGKNNDNLWFLIFSLFDQVFSNDFLFPYYPCYLFCFQVQKHFHWIMLSNGHCHLY